jgi:hypothetical protein
MLADFHYVSQIYLLFNYRIIAFDEKFLGRGIVGGGGYMTWEKIT